MRRAVNQRLDYVSAGFRGYLQALIDGSPTKVLLQSSTVLSFGAQRVIIDAATTVKGRNPISIRRPSHRLLRCVQEAALSRPNPEGGRGILHC